jgi:serine protease Do
MLRSSTYATETFLVFWSLLLLPAAAQESPKAPETQQDEVPRESDPPRLSVERTVEQVKRSLVAISVAARDGRQQGMGTGFIISPEGLVATNLHVIGDGREFTIETVQGVQLPVLAIHASDRFHDLAVIKVDPQGQTLPYLQLGGIGQVQQGQTVVVMGSPLGLKHSAVSGVISAIRNIDGKEMLQLAMPIEPGNSGGPVVDLHGRVHGVVSLKSVLDEDVGFAVDAEQLGPLLEKPNPISVERWVTIGSINRAEWEPRLGARWRQRGGHLLVSGHGTGFGGRSLCLAQRKPPANSYELGVAVKLDDESGAAGLIFHSDSQDKHYGFYPTGGQLRLTCFRGPTVYSWKILETVSSKHYRPGHWNHLKVHIADEKISCYVNDHLVIESTDKTFVSGRVGLAKFRHTVASFRKFQVAQQLPPSQLTPEQTRQLVALVDGLPEFERIQPGQLEPFHNDGAAVAEMFERRADLLEQRAKDMRRLAIDVHVRGVATELNRLATKAGEFDLLRGALLLAKMDERDLDVEAYVNQLDKMTGEIKSALPHDPDERTRLVALNAYLFQQNGYHGSRFEYYHRANSYLNRVIDDREGIPVTLSVLYMEMGRKLGLKIDGVGLPGHFVVRHVSSDGSDQLVDVFEGGKFISHEDAEAIVLRYVGRPLQDEDFQPTPPKEILRRMVRNLGALAERDRDSEALLRYVDAMIGLFPQEGGLRHDRGVLRAMTGRNAAALADFDWVLKQQLPGLDLQKVRELRLRLVPRATSSD